MKYALLVLSASVLLLVGCQSTTFDLKDDPQFQQTMPVCQSDAECDKVWDAARAWINKTTPQGLAVDTPERLQTHPADAEALDWETDISVNKVALGEGKYRITIQTLCNPSFNDCGAERSRMRQFNEEMAQYVSSSQAEQTLQIIREGIDMSALFRGYASAMQQEGLQAHAQHYFLPALIIHGSGDVRELRSKEDVLGFLAEIQAQLADNDIRRIEAQNQQILTSNATTTILQLQWAFFDSDGELQYRQKAIYHLIKVGQDWKIITLSYAD